jgi:hypothetical protein
MDQKEKVQNTATRGLEHHDAPVKPRGGEGEVHELLKYFMKIHEYNINDKFSRNFINCLQNLDDEERDIAMKTIERIEVRVNKAYDEAIGILTIWCNRYVSKNKKDSSPSDEPDDSYIDKISVIIHR